MSNLIFPCCWFNGNAREAAEFYCAIFEDSKLISDSKMVVNFELCGKKIMGINGGPDFAMNPSISFTIATPSTEQTSDIWHKLINGGSAMIELGKYPWSEQYGWLKDKFGLTWQITNNSNQSDKISLTPSLLFTGTNFGKAREAFEFYELVFENSTTKMMVNYPPGDPNEGKLMYGEFILRGTEINAMDGPGEHNFSFNEAISFVIHCKDQDEIDHHWSSLIENGGQESMCGWLKDKYGISWQVLPENLGELMSDPIKGQRVMNEILKMKKLDYNTLKNA